MASNARSTRRCAGGTICAALAVLALTYAVAGAAMTFEPYSDSSRVVYAGLASFGLGIGSCFLALATRTIALTLIRPGALVRAEPLVYLLSIVTVTIPIAIAASNGLEASSAGQGGPSILIDAIGGVGLAAGLGRLMHRGIALGLVVAALLAGALAVAAVITAR
jgi:hypothetical protein